jgi:hypothetical protein
LRRTSTSSAIERKAADRYRAEGYEVTEKPARDVLPPGLKSYQPDFIAVRGDEKVAVEVKRGPTLASEQQLRDIAEVFRATPGWRFDLVVVGDDDQAGVRPPPVLTKSGYLARLKTADLIASSAKDYSAAMLLLWTVTEAALRRLLQRSGDNPRLLGTRLVKAAYSRGLIDASEFRSLESLARIRNAVVHGARPDSDATAQTYMSSKRLVERLLQRLP